VSEKSQHGPGEGAQPGSGGGSQSGSDAVALTRSPGFWLLMRYAALFGVVLAFAALAFLGLVKGGTNLWFTLPKNPGWLDGSLWWVAVTAAAGVLVGVLRRVFRLPMKLPGTVQELKDQRVEPSTVLKAVAVSTVSLAGGASLGPEDALGKMGGGLGTWVSERRKLDDDLRATNTLTGMSGAYGGMLSAPILAAILVLELARPKAARFADALVAGLLSASVSFAVYFPIAGSTFVGIYTLPTFKYEDWQLLAAVPLGLVAGALAMITAVTIGVLTRLTAPLADRTILRSTIGGVAFGLVGVALPLTLFTGTSQLTTVIHDGAALGAGLLIAVVFAKILVFALCEATGFIGGPFLVMLFIGGTAGIATHVLIPGLPEGLAFTAMFAALPGSLVAAPFSLILLGVITTQIGALQVAPVTVAVLTAYLAVSGTGVLVALARRQAKPTTTNK
jgi:H+/Cl- antiporter ClcA